MQFREETQVSKEHYFSDIYLNTDRFLSFREQILAILTLEDINTIFEVGKGNGVVEAVLKSFKYDVKTIDIDESLNPDILCSVLELDSIKERRDLTVCCEVLEHIPFENFEKAIFNLKNISEKYILISLPYVGFFCGFEIRWGRYGVHQLSSMFRLPLFWIKHKFDGQHYWEVGKKGYSFETIKNKINKILKIKKVWFHPFHKGQVFILCSNYKN